MRELDFDAREGAVRRQAEHPVSRLSIISMRRAANWPLILLSFLDISAPSMSEARGG
jgi:hypothetical protein